LKKAADLNADEPSMVDPTRSEWWHSSIARIVGLRPDPSAAAAAVVGGNDEIAVG
jgi:hypothetical protein